MNLDTSEALRAASDEDLAHAVKQGRMEAFDELIRRHQGRVFAVAYRFCGNREDAMDVAQDAFVKAFRRIESWRPTGSFVAWLMRLTSNQAIDHVRKVKRQRIGREAVVRQAEEARKADLASPVQAEREVRGGEIDERVQRGMDVLSPAQRTVFILRHYEGMKLSEIAPVVGCSVGSVKVHLFRALRKLRVELGDLREE